ncbi:MAG: dihydroorotase [Sphingomonadales bacterium]|nr:dihydroorotase [Sphingomonadales bacterium]
MGKAFDSIIKGGTIVSVEGSVRADIGIKDGRFAEIGSLDESLADEVIDATGLHILPGVIDTQVHFREPGNEHKEDLASGSLAAVMGGVTAVFEMPNTKPSTTTKAAIEDKLNRAHDRMWCDHAFYVGATNENAESLAELEKMPGTSGVKIFMGASTGDLLVAGDDGLRAALSSGERRVAIHSEDEFRMNERLDKRVAGDPSSHPIWRDDETAIRSTKRLLKISKEVGRKVHVLHISTAQEMDILRAEKAAGNKLLTVEILPQHLTVGAPDCYERFGTLAQQNPPIRDASHMAGLWAAVNDGTVDVIGSDHAPHTKEEKAQTYPDSPSGMPGVQTLLPVMLNHVAEGRLTLGKLVELTSFGARRIFGLKDKGAIEVGLHADVTFVDLDKKWTVDESWLKSKCGWSLFTGMTLKGKPFGTMIRGKKIMWNDKLIGTPQGEPITFNSTS